MTASPTPTLTEPAAPWPAVDFELRRRIERDGLKLVDLWERSKIPLADNQRQCPLVLDALFGDNPLLVFGKSCITFNTKSREELRGLEAEYQLIIPNPVTARLGRCGPSELESRAERLCGPRRYIIASFNDGNIDSQAARLAFLAVGAPLACVCANGEGLCGWFNVALYPEDRVETWFRYGVSIGCDPAYWKKTAWTVLPESMDDDTGKKRAAFYLDPSPTAKPL
jgi:hypothetical protein